MRGPDAIKSPVLPLFSPLRLDGDEWEIILGIR